jgi:hypothetical protein
MGCPHFAISKSGRRLWSLLTPTLTARNDIFQPNAFLTKTVEGKKPGKALDMAHPWPRQFEPRPWEGEP